MKTKTVQWIVRQMCMFLMVCVTRPTLEVQFLYWVESLHLTY